MMSSLLDSSSNNPVDKLGNSFYIQSEATHPPPHIEVVPILNKPKNVRKNNLGGCPIENPP